MKTSRRVVCTHPGCRESSLFAYDSKKEMRESTTDFQNWKCVRHSQPDRVLSPTNSVRTVTAVACKSKHASLKEKLFWEGGGFLNSSFVSGPGFKAFANDFPEGTKLTVTATVSLPPQ